jgi:hypothetical protein
LKTRNLLKSAGGQRPGSNQVKPEEKAKAPGPGRNGAAAYTGANREKVPHATLQGSDTCQGCLQGKVSPLKARGLPWNYRQALDELRTSTTP